MRKFGTPRFFARQTFRPEPCHSGGQLSGGLGSPSVFPYQPEGYYANLQFPDRDYLPSKDDRQHRRGLYMHWQRTFLHPMLLNFDAPPCEECTAVRWSPTRPSRR